MGHREIQPRITEAFCDRCNKTGSRSQWEDIDRGWRAFTPPTEDPRAHHHPAPILLCDECITQFRRFITAQSDADSLRRNALELAHLSRSMAGEIREWREAARLLVDAWNASKVDDGSVGVVVDRIATILASWEARKAVQ